MFCLNIFLTNWLDVTKTIIPLALMGSESIDHEAFAIDSELIRARGIIVNYQARLPAADPRKRQKSSLIVYRSDAEPTQMRIWRKSGHFNKFEKLTLRALIKQGNESDKNIKPHIASFICSRSLFQSFSVFFSEMPVWIKNFYLSVTMQWHLLTSLQTYNLTGNY